MCEGEVEEKIIFAKEFQSLFMRSLVPFVAKSGWDESEAKNVRGK